MLAIEQTEERLHAAVLEEEGPLPARRLLLEEAKGRQNHPGGPHETQSSRNRGQSISHSAVLEDFLMSKSAASTRPTPIQSYGINRKYY